MEDGVERESRPGWRSAWGWAVAIGYVIALIVFAFRYGRSGECLSLGPLDGRHFAAIETLGPTVVPLAIVLLRFDFDRHALQRGLVRLARHVVRPVPLDREVISRHELTQLIVVPLMLILTFFIVDLVIDAYARTDREMRSLPASERVLRECERNGIALSSWGLAER